MAPNKLMAKLLSGMNKPNGQTLVLPANIPALLHPLPVSRIKGLGGMLGERIVAELKVTTIGELAQVPIGKLEQLYGTSTGTSW